MVLPAATAVERLTDEEVTSEVVMLAAAAAASAADAAAAAAGTGERAAEVQAQAQATAADERLLTAQWVAQLVEEHASDAPAARGLAALALREEDAGVDEVSTVVDDAAVAAILAAEADNE